MNIPSFTIPILKFPISNNNVLDMNVTSQIVHKYCENYNNQNSFLYINLDNILIETLAKDILTNFTKKNDQKK